MDTSILVHIVPPLITFLIGCAIYDRQPAKRLAEIKAVLRAQQRSQVLSWHDLYDVIAPHEKG